MFNKIRKLFGKTNIDTFISDGDVASIVNWLKDNRVRVPSRPLRMLDATTFTPEDLKILTAEENDHLSLIESEGFDPWIIGEGVLPIFTNDCASEIFVNKISNELNMVFCSGSIRFNIFKVPILDRINEININPFTNNAIVIKRTDLHL